MKALIDANVLISVLLNPDRDTPPFRIIQSAVRQEFELLIGETTISETLASISSKSYLATRIEQPDADALIRVLRRIATIIPELDTKLPSFTRDRDDDYLVAHAVLEAVDYLVTGDKDLLAVSTIRSVRIVTPTIFSAIVDSQTDPLA